MDRWEGKCCFSQVCLSVYSSQVGRYRVSPLFSGLSATRDAQMSAAAASGDYFILRKSGQRDSSAGRDRRFADKYLRSSDCSPAGEQESLKRHWRLEWGGEDGNATGTV